MKSLPAFSEFFGDLVRSCELMISENKVLLISIIVLYVVKLAFPIAAIPESEGMLLFSVLVSIASFVLTFFSQLFLARWLLINVGAAPEGHLRTLRSAVVPFVLTTLLAATLVGAASILLVIPGIIFYFAFLVKDFVLLTSKRNYLDALIESRILMDGAKWQVFTYALVIFVPFVVMQLLVDWATKHVEPGTTKIGLLLLKSVITEIYLFLNVSFQGNVFVHVRRKQL